MKKTILSILFGIFFIIIKAQTPPVIYVAADGSGDYNCDGISDQIEINQALDFVAANTEYTTVYLKGATTFVIDQPVIMSSNTILTGDPTTSLKLKDGVGWWTHNKPMISQKNRQEWDSWGNEGDSISNVEIYGFEVDGGVQFEPSGDAYIPLIHFYFPNNVSVHDMYMHNSRWDIVRMSSSVGYIDIQSKVYNNRIEYSGHEGICFVGVTNFQAYNNTIYSTRTNTGIRAKDCDHFSIFSNRIGNSIAKRPSGYVGILLENEHTTIEEAEVFDNLIYGKNGGIHVLGQGGIYPTGTRKNVHIHHNKIFKCNKAMTSDGFALEGGIKIDGYQNTLIEHNVIEGGVTSAIIYEGTSGGGAGYQTIVRNNIIVDNKGYGISNKEPSFHTFISNNNLIYNNNEGSYNNTTSIADINENPLFASTHSSVNEWHHILASYDNATETFKIYVDGKEQAKEQITGFGSIGSNNNDLLLGGYRAIAYWMEGMQDELAIWNRALTTEEVNLLYNNGVAQNMEAPLTADLQFYLQMENNWDDSSGNGFNAIDYTAGFTSDAANGDYAGLFTGTDGVQYPTNLSTTSGLTISVWVYRTNIGEGEQTILAKGSQGNNDHIWLYFRNESVFFELGNGTDRFGLEANILNPWELDFHLQSEAGRWNETEWIDDPVSSPCIDKGDPSSAYVNELAPNGNRVNIGVYGNTEEASKSPFTSQTTTTYVDTEQFIYPNPTFDKVYIADRYINSTYEILSVAGVIVKKGVLHNNEINLSRLGSGTYFVKITEKETGEISTSRLIVD